MTAGLLEGLTSSIGDELTELSGFRTTRVTALAETEDRVQTGINDATSADSGLTITFTAPIANTGPIAVGQRFRLLSDPDTNVLQTGVATASGFLAGTRIVLTSGTFAATVQPGRSFRVTSGPLTGKTATINQRVSDTEVLLDGIGIGIDFTAVNWSVLFNLTNREAPIASIAFAGPLITGLTLSYPLGANFTAQSWEVVRRAATSLAVETTLDWEPAGEAFVGSTRYRYDAKTLATLTGLRATSHHGAMGRMTMVTGALIADGETFTIDDGRGTVVIFEFQKTATALPDIRHITLNITNAMTAAQVGAAVIDGIVRLAAMNIRAFVGSTTDSVELRHGTPGGTGLIDVIDTVANAGFITDGPRGIESDVVPLTDVVDYSLRFSGTDQYRNSFIVERAVGDDLSTLGRNLGVERPAELIDDEIYRRLIAAMAYSPRGTVLAIELVLNAIFGPGNWEFFEDLTLGSVNHTCEVFLRRRDENELESAGKTFLDGDELQPMTSATALTLAQTPIRVEGLRLAPEGGERLIALGSNATVTPSANQVANVSGPAAAFPTAIKPGDLFVITSGPARGTTGLIRSRTSDTALVLGPLPGSENLIIDETFTTIAWKVVRRRSNFRHYRPSEEAYIERPGGPSTPIWEVQGTLAGSESTYVTIVADPLFGPYLRIEDSGGGAVVADTIYYRHRARIDASSIASFAVHMNVDTSVTLSAGSDNTKQATLQIEDGARLIMVGMTWDGVGDDRDIGFILSSGAYIGSPVKLDLCTPITCQWRTIEILKIGESVVHLLVDGKIVLSKAYALFPVSTANRQIAFGVQVTNDFGKMEIKEVDWGIITPRDFWNSHPAVLATTTFEHVTDAAASFRAVDDDLPVKKRVRLRGWSVLNSGGGNAKGQWEINTYVNNADVVVRGPTKGRGFFTFGAPSRFSVRGEPDAFIWPDTRGHSLEILTGPNAGVYPISALLDPVTSLDIEEPPTNPNTSGDFLVISTDATDGTFGVISISDPLPTGPVIVLWGKVGGIFTSATVELIPGQGILVTSPTFDNGSIVAIGLTNNSGNREAVFRGDIIVYEGPAGSQVTEADGRFEVIRLPAGMRAYGGRALTTQLAASWSFPANQFQLRPTNMLELDTAAGVPPRPDGFEFTEDEVTWRIVPNFPSDVSVTGEIVDAGTAAGAALTLRHALPITPAGEYPIVAAARSLVLSAQLLDEKEENTLVTAPDDYSHYPFYLADNFGFVRSVVDLVTAAGVRADFDRLFRDAAGLHLIGGE